MAFDIAVARRDLGEILSTLGREAADVFERLVRPGWNGDLHGYPATLIGYVMDVFAHIDLLSSYWRGTGATEKQMARMADFMLAYMWSDRDAVLAAIRIWRNAPMHTGQPRPIRSKTGVEYRWLLHWGEPYLPRDHHATFQPFPQPRVLNVGLMFLITDLERAFEAYLADLERHPVLQANYLKADPAIKVTTF